jgi:hypothetical protein
MLTVPNFLHKLQPILTSASHNKNRILPFLSCLPILILTQNLYTWHAIANLTLQRRKNLCPSVKTTSLYSTEHKRHENQKGLCHYSLLQIIYNTTLACQINAAHYNYYPYPPAFPTIHTTVPAVSLTICQNRNSTHSSTYGVVTLTGESWFS